MAHEPNQQDYRLPADSFLATTAWKVSAALAVVGLLGSLAGLAANPNRFGYSYLFGFFTVATVMLGAMFLVLIQHMTAGHWGVTSRRGRDLTQGYSSTGNPRASSIGISFASVSANSSAGSEPATMPQPA